MRIVFPVVPFADIGRPAMGVGLLIAEARAAGHDARAIYVNIDLASAVGLVPYQRIATSFPPNLLIGEWIFAADLFGDQISSSEDFFGQIVIPYLGQDRDLLAAIMEIRRVMPEWLDRWADEIMASRPDVVGFSTVFHQTCACLALARRLKARADAPIVVFGGANCEGEMGLQLIRSFPCINHLCS